MDWENKYVFFVEMNTRISTHSEHFLEFPSNFMGTLDQHGIKDCYLMMDNAVIHKVDQSKI
ncbi:hypothetical protein BDF14DRAFT_802184 [Spinellus fusiger]|nr:hypothetical protein BDF14DRAFT_802184 [Spinellus fusiger]